MIKKLKRKFNILVITSVFCLLLLIVGGMILISFNTLEREADELIDQLPLEMVFDENSHETPKERKPVTDRAAHIPIRKRDKDKIPSYIFDQNYFSVIYDRSGEITYMNLDHISTVSEERALNCATDAFESNDSKGFVQNFRYMKVDVDENTGIIFLNCIKEMHSFKDFVIISLTMTVIGFIIVIIVTLAFSAKFTRPIVKSNQKQKQFITDAGHSLKTPLSVINANLDLLESELEGNESFEDIRHQVDLLTDLTNDLVSMAQVEETGNRIQRLDFPISDLISETISKYKTPARNKNIELISNIEPMLSFNGDSNLIKPLIFILMDNAIKYSPENGRVEVGLKKKNKQIILTVFNTTAREVNKKHLPHVFDRFFRGDYSGDSETRGYGIGLSKAKSIVEAHNGKITAKSNDKYSFIITIIFPA